MKTVSMSGALRAHVGKKDAKGHRKEGKVPCVLYGGDEQIHFTLDEKAFIKILFTPEVYIINISIDGKEHRAVLQDIQYHPVNDKVLHADFLQLVPGKPVKTALPITIEGNAPGVLQGGKLVQKIRKLKVLGIADDLPDNLVLNIDNLNIGDSIKVKDIKMENIKFLDNPNAQVITVKTARGAGAEEVEEEAAGAAEETAAEGAETKKESEE